MIICYVNEKITNTRAFSTFHCSVNYPFYMLNLPALSKSLGSNFLSSKNRTREINITKVIHVVKEKHISLYIVIKY